MLSTFSIFSENAKKSPRQHYEKKPENDLSQSRLPKIDVKHNSHTSSLFLTAKTTSRDFRTTLVSDKTVSNKEYGSISLKKTTNGFHKSHFLDDKVLTDKLILDLNPGKVVRRRRDLFIKEETSMNKIKGFVLKKDRKKTVDMCDFKIDDSISENYLKSIMTINDRGSEMIHCEEFRKKYLR